MILPKLDSISNRAVVLGVIVFFTFAIGIALYFGTPANPFEFGTPFLGFVILFPTGLTFGQDWLAIWSGTGNLLGGWIIYIGLILIYLRANKPSTARILLAAFAVLIVLNLFGCAVMLSQPVGLAP